MDCFKLDISMLGTTIQQFKNSISDAMDLRGSFSNANSELTIHGWSGQSANSFKLKNNDWSKDFSTYIGNMQSLHQTLCSIQRQAEVLNTQALGLGGIFGCSTSGSKKLLTRLRSALDEVFSKSGSLIDKYYEDLYDLDKLSALAADLEYSQLSTKGTIDSWRSALKTKQDKLRRLMSALNTYTNGINALEQTMKQWSAQQLPAWGQFVQDYFAATGMRNSPDDIAALLKDANALNAVLAVILGVNYHCQYGGDPVNMASGNFVYQKEYLRTSGAIPLFFMMFYNAQDLRIGSAGAGWTHNFEVNLTQTDDQAVIILEDGKREIFTQESNGTYSNFEGQVATLVQNEDESFTYQIPGEAIYCFNDTGKLQRVEGENASCLQLHYGEYGELTSVANDSGQALHFEHQGNKLIAVTDDAARGISLAFEGDTLVGITDELGSVTNYAYGETERIVAVTNALGITTVANEYDKAHRITRQTSADGGVLTYSYDDEASRVQLDEQNGNAITYVHDERYRSTETIYFDGSETSVYDEKNQLISFIDKRGGSYKYQYDKTGNLVCLENPLGEVIATEYTSHNRPAEVKVCDKMQLRATYDEHGNALEIQDGLGRCTKRIYDKAGRPTTIILPDDSEIALTYDARGNISTIRDHLGATSYEYTPCDHVSVTVDPLGNKTVFEYNKKGDITQVVNALGQKRAYEYNALDRLTCVTDFDGTRMHQEYDVTGKPSALIDQEGNSTTVEYDLCGNVVVRRDPLENVTAFDYDQLGRLIKVIAPTGIVVARYEYDPNGNRTKVTGARGESTEFSYDALNRVQTITEADGAKTALSYNALGQITSTTDALGNKHAYSYDDVGQLVETENPIGQKTTYTYTALGQIAAVVGPSGLKTTYDYLPGGLLGKVVYPDNRSAAYQYDANKNLVCQTTRDGNTLSYEYDCLGRIVKTSTAHSIEKHYVYDCAGNVVSVTDALGNTTHYTYSPGGKVTSMTDPLGARVEYDYDKLGLISKVTQFSELDEAKRIHKGNAQQNITTYTRTAIGQIASITDALGNSETYTYDAVGNVISKLDKDAYLTQYDYDAFGQLEQVTYADGSTAAFEYNALRQLTRVKDWLGTTSIELDALGRATKIVNLDGKEVGYEFGPAGERVGVTYPDGTKVSYEYDEALRLKNLTDGDMQIAYAYDSNSNITEKSFSNGLVTKYAYNTLGLLQELTHLDSEGVLDRYSYRYDSLLNKSAIETFRRDMSEVSGNYTYSYDALQRLTEVTKDDTSLRSFGYDSFGNRNYVVDKGVRTDYTYNSLHQCVRTEGAEGSSQFTYDARGNLTQTQEANTNAHRYEYGPLGRLSSSINPQGQTSHYTYNGLGHRVGMHVEDGFNPTKNINYTLDLTRQYNNLLQVDAGSTPKTYLWDQDIVAEKTSSDKQFYLNDDLGSPLRFVNGKGDIADSYSYDEFGKDLTANQGTLQPFGYTGYTFDTTSQTYFAQLRQYQSGLGRFVSEDTHWNTLSMIYGDANRFLPDTDAIKQSTSLYAYCMNDPLGHVDKLGAWAPSLHYNSGGAPESQFGTYAWAYRDLKISSQVANIIASGDSGIDDLSNGTSAITGVGQPGLHFNTASNPLSGADSRLEAAHSAMNAAVFGKQDFEEERARSLSKSYRVISGFNSSYNSINAEYDAKQYTVLGQGLHSLQDIFAHGDKGLAGVDLGHGGGLSPFVDDSLLAYLGVPSHIFNGNNNFDNTQYDWADCTMTKVKNVGKREKSTRYKSTELATKGYLGSAYFEMTGQ